MLSFPLASGTAGAVVGGGRSQNRDECGWHLLCSGGRPHPSDVMPTLRGVQAHHPLQAQTRACTGPAGVLVPGSGRPWPAPVTCDGPGSRHLPALERCDSLCASGHTGLFSQETGQTAAHECPPLRGGEGRHAAQLRGSHLSGFLRSKGCATQLERSV